MTTKMETTQENWDLEIEENAEPDFRLYGGAPTHNILQTYRPNKNPNNICKVCLQYQDYRSIETCGQHYCLYCNANLAAVGGYFAWLRHLGRCSRLPLPKDEFYAKMCSCRK